LSKQQSRRRARRLAMAAGAGAGAAFVAATPAVAQDFMVTTLNPDGAAGSLRSQIEQANSTPGADRILFQSGLTGTIELSEGDLGINEDLRIVGPGAADITIDGGARGHVFSLYGPGENPLVAGISGLTIQNAEEMFGGAIMSGNADLTLEDSVVTGNRSVYNGAAVYAGLAGSLTVRNSTFSRNASGTGGAIFVGNQDVLIQNSTFERNRASEFGGALAAAAGDSPHSIEIENSTFVRNTGGLAGGAITPLGSYAPEEAFQPSLEIRSSTISGNSAIAAGGGITGGFSESVIENSIVAGNSAIYGPDLYSGSFGSGPQERAGDCGCTYEYPFGIGFSLVEDPAQAEIDETVAGSNILGEDPELDSLADNGGPTRTLALEADSPAINKGASPLSTDQRGEKRPVLYPGIPNSAAPGANGADMGAFELQYEQPRPPEPPVKNGPFKILDSTPNPNGTAIVRVKVPAPGEVTLVGYRRLKTVTKRADAKGIFKFRATPKGKLKQRLKKRGRAQMVVRFHYDPDAGRTLSKARVFPLIKGMKSRKAAIAAVREFRRLAPWAGR